LIYVKLSAIKWIIIGWIYIILFQSQNIVHIILVPQLVFVNSLLILE